MKPVKIVGERARFGAGNVLRLTDEQASSRKHALELIEEGTYAVLSPVEFKQGEVIGVFGDEVPKNIASIVEWQDSTSDEDAAALSAIGVTRKRRPARARLE